MRVSSFSVLAVAAVLPSSTHAVKGVISDTLTSDEQGCRSLCGLNDACLMALYQLECRECWLMDCSLEFLPKGFTGAGKHTIEIKPTCDSSLVPKPREDGCKNAPGTTTTTSPATATATNDAAGSTETGGQGSAAWRMSISWLPLSAVVAAGIVVAA